MQMLLGNQFENIMRNDFPRISENLAQRKLRQNEGPTILLHTSAGATKLVMREGSGWRKLKPQTFAKGQNLNERRLE